MENIIKKKLFRLLIIISALTGLLSAPAALAVCPVCVVAVGAGVGLSRWLGIDDSISGLWIGGMIVSLSVWTNDWLMKKNVNFRNRGIIIAAIFYAITIFPLYYSDIIGHIYNKFCGVDKLILGIFVGSVFFFAANKWYVRLKEKNNDRAHFPFQKVVMPVATLILLSIIFYFLTNC